MRAAVPARVPDVTTLAEMCVAGVDLRELVYPEGLRIPAHAHQTAGFCLVLAGTYAERYGALSLECRPQTVTFSPAGAEHVNIFAAAPSRCFTIDVPGAWLERLECSPLEMRNPFDRNGGALAPLAARLLHECRDRDAATSLMIEGLVLELIGEAARSARQAPEARVSPAIRRVRELLEAHFTEPLLLADIATAVGRHPVYLAANFRAAYGETIGECVRRLRVERACRELAGTELPLAAIALSSGFASQSHLTRVFKRVTGLTPAAYRRRLSPGHT